MSQRTVNTGRWRSAPLPGNELERLRALDSYQILDTPAEAGFDDLTWLAGAICGAPIALVTMVAEGRQWFKSSLGLPARETPRDESFCSHAILRPADMLVVEDATKDDRFADNPLVLGDPAIRFYAGVPLITPDGLPIGTFCVIDRVPRTLNAEQTRALRVLAGSAMALLDLRRSVREMREQRAQLLRTLNTVPTAIMILAAPSGEIVLQNRAAEDLLGASFQVLNKDGATVPPKDWGTFRALNGETVHGQELKIATAAGRVVPIYLNAAPIRNAAGVIVGAVAGFQDITALAELGRLKDDFVATVSHELRTPLTSIKGSLQLLAADETLGPDQAQLLGVASANADRLVRMVNDILDMAKIEAGALALQRTRVMVADLARAAFQNVRPIATGAGIELEVSVEAGVRPIFVDTDRMVQALVNLLSNAIKFAPRGSTVTLAATRRDDGGVAIAVHDAGGGIPPDRLPGLFEKFTQLQPGATNQGRGTGLGLTITKALVEQHGATITVRSSPQTGTTFTIDLAGDGTSFAQVTASPAADA